jgi:hypothetical protein
MATYIKGNAVANATSYELAEKTAEGTYNSLETKNEINFELNTLGLAAGDHTLVVKAKADGYEDSDYSNEVVYTIEPTYYTITYKYVDARGTTIKTDTTETVTAGTVKNFTAPTIIGYIFSSASHTSATVNSDITVTYTYTADGAVGEITDYIQEGKAIVKVGELSDNAAFFAVVNYPVKGATYYAIPYARNAYCLTASGATSGGILNGGGSETATLRAAGTAATMSICFKYDDISPSEVTITETVAPA